jgi:hypothetical protein
MSNFKINHLYLRDALFCRCFEHGQYRQALGIAIETKRIDVFERAVTGELTDVQVGTFSTLCAAYYS